VGDDTEMPLEFILYVRSNCPLCEAMEDELRPLINEYSIIVNRRYIDNEPALEKLYGSKVPVLTRNHETLCEYFLDKELIIHNIKLEHD
jgi:hypothetical protein